jgi:hypothetical protein
MSPDSHRRHIRGQDHEPVTITLIVPAVPAQVGTRAASSAKPSDDQNRPREDRDTTAA